MTARGVSPVELAALPFAFTQLRPLMPHEFIRAARDRHVHLSEEQLEAFHRLRLLTPLLRVRRDGRAIRTARRRGDRRTAADLARSHPTSPSDVRLAYAEGRLQAPAHEGFVARRRLIADLGDRRYRTSDYLYSHHQLIALPRISGAVHFVERDGRGGHRAPRLSRYWLETTVDESRRLDTIVTAVSALEAVYLPKITGRLSLRFQRYQEYEAWRRKLPVTWALNWLGVDAQWFRVQAAGLLRSADQIDPLGDWLDVVREADPSSWERLRGAARSAVDMRVAAEVLLRYYDDLARARRARRLPKRQLLRRTAFDTRLKPRRELDDVLTRFGLSPEPSLLLVVEGATERLLFPRVMQMFEVATDRQFIHIVDRGGADRDIEALVAYAVAPQTEPASDGALELIRPPTRLLVVSDPEGKMTTAEQRERQCRAWTDRLLRELPSEQRSDEVREQLALLVAVETWNARGESFEFANLTDRQLARAVRSLHPEEDAPALSVIAMRVQSLRASAGNLKKLLPQGRSKVDLAEALWPLLEERILRATKRGTEARIPIVRVLDRALDLATEFPRGGLVLSTPARASS